LQGEVMPWLIYRDRDTGRFVKKQVWKRAKKRGSKRYKREKIKPKPPPPPPPEGPVYEWIVSFSYDKSGRSFDVITTARSETEAYKVAMEFLRSTPDGKNIVRAGFSGWKVVPTRGNKSELEAGNAEYRSKSKGSRKRSRKK